MSQMVLFALDPWWSDFYTFWGFVVGVLGFLVGVVGFWYTLRQVWKVEAAAQAAATAAKRTLAESKESYTRFVGTLASRLLFELQRSGNAKDWKLAELRALDLASLLGTVGAKPRVRELCRELREYAQKFARRAAGDNPKFSEEKWVNLLNELHSEIDGLNTPFKEAQHGQVGPSDPGREVSPDRQQPAPEDTGGPSELDPGPPSRGEPK